jgi:hypothetical protein
MKCAQARPGQGRGVARGAGAKIICAGRAAAWTEGRKWIGHGDDYVPKLLRCG